MQRGFVICVLAAAATGCLPTFEKETIIVDGEGEVSVAPDTFAINAQFFASGATSEQALAALSEKIDTALSAAPQLEGVDRVVIVTQGASTEPILEEACARNANYSDRDRCAAVGQTAVVSTYVTGAPAEAAGDMLSYLSELGARKVNFLGFLLEDKKPAQENATEAAVADARARAERLAAASGAALGRARQIQYGDGLRDDWRPSDAARPSLEVSAPAPALRVAPAVSLSLTPQPIVISEKVTIQYAIRYRSAE